jgi:DNA-binding NtrC family response regulator
MEILVAEDESIIALDIKTILTAQSYAVIGTERTYAGIELRVTDHSPDLLITSLSLKNSKDYFEKIVTLQSKYKFKVLFLSAAMNLLQYKNKCDSSYFSFLQKPFEPDNLISSIKSLQEKTIDKKL